MSIKVSKMVIDVTFDNDNEFILEVPNTLADELLTFIEGKLGHPLRDSINKLVTENSESEKNNTTPVFH